MTEQQIRARIIVAHHDAVCGCASHDDVTTFPTPKHLDAYVAALAALLDAAPDREALADRDQIARTLHARRHQSDNLATWCTFCYDAADALLAGTSTEPDAATKASRPTGSGETKGEKDGKHTRDHPRRARRVARGPDSEGLQGRPGIPDRAGPDPSRGLAEVPLREIADPALVGASPRPEQGTNAAEPRCSTCGDTGLIEWIVEMGWPDNEDDMQPCPDCAVHTAEPDAALRERIEALCDDPDVHRPYAAYVRVGRLRAALDGPPEGGSE